MIQTRRHVFQIVMTSVVLLAAACVPTKYGYYHPSGPGTVRSFDACDATPDGIEMLVSKGLIVRVQAYRAQGGSLAAYGSYEVAAGHQLHLIREEIRLQDSSDQSSILSVPTTVKIDAKSDGQKLTLSISANIEGRRPFLLQLPDVEFDGVAMSGPTVRYEWVDRTVWKPLCM